MEADPSRREFLKLAAGAFCIGLAFDGDAARLVAPEPASTAQSEASVTAWVHISPANEVTVIASQAEMGQGITTTLAAALCDELGADWSTLKLRTAPFAPAYRNPKANWMFTGNSESIQSFYLHVRRMGAAAREMLVSAAATRWSVQATECQTSKSFVTHKPSGRRVSFGELALEASRLAVPAQPALKADRDLQLVGRSIARIDVPEKVAGTAVFGIDFKLPGLLTAAVRTGPAIGSSVKRFDEAAAKAVRGVVAVVPVQNGVAVVADTYWHARRGLDALQLEFDAGPHADLDSKALAARYDAAIDGTQWARAAKHGKPVEWGADLAIVREYDNPWAAHATMEPMNCTAHVTDTRCEIWAPTQGQELAHVVLKNVFKLPDDQVVVNRTPYLGGGFGRRLLPDFVVQAALIAKAVGQPVKTIWDREEDIRRDHFRPGTRVRLAAKARADGSPETIAARAVSPTILLSVYPPIQQMLDTQGIDPSAMEGLMELPYELDGYAADFHLLKVPIPTTVMRTTGYGPNVFALESFIDELAHLAKQDPYRYRRTLLQKRPHALAVLDRAAALSHWDQKLPPGHGRGIAYTEAFGSLLAQVIEVQARGSDIKLKRVTSVVDCGRTLDPKIAAQGIEGGVVFGLAYCKTEITFEQGRAVEDNFNRYALPYLSETPPMVTQFITSDRKLGGVGEVSPVTVPPALANAIFAATGKRLRSMPLARHGLQFV